MSLTLAANLGTPVQLDPAIRLDITGTVPDAIVPGYLFRLEDEVLELRYFGRTTQAILGGAATQTIDDRNTWYVQRGVAGTVIAAHAAGTAVLGVSDALVAGTTEVVPVPPFGAAGATLPIAQSDVTGLVAALAAKPRLLYGDNYTVDLTNTDETVLSASFATGDVGRLIIGPGIPSETTIVSVVAGVSAELSAPASATGTFTANLEPVAPAAGDVWFRPFENPEGGGYPMGVLLTRSAANDAWLTPALAVVDSGGNLVSVQAESSTGTVAMYVRRPDASYIAQVRLTPTTLRILTNDDGADIQVAAANTAGDVVSTLIILPNLVSVTTAGTFLYNGAEVATVP